MRSFWCSIVLACLAISPIASGEEYQGIFWNLESGNSDGKHLAKQAAAKSDIDFWGLSEVADQQVVDDFVRALKQRNPNASYSSKLSHDGGGDKLAIIFRSDRLESVAFSGPVQVDDLGDNFFELDSVNVNGGLRPALGVQLKSKDGQQVIVLVNHLKCCGNGEKVREKQATALNAFVLSVPGVPIIAGGDFNIPMVGNSAPLPQKADDVLSTVFEYREPKNSQVGSHTSGSVLDAVWIANRVPGWTSETKIIEREGDKVLATARQFPDDGNGPNTDHRPLHIAVKSDVTERIEALREEIAIFEAQLKRAKQLLAQLEAGQ